MGVSLGAWTPFLLAFVLSRVQAVVSCEGTVAMVMAAIMHHFFSREKVSGVRAVVAAVVDTRTLFSRYR